MPTELNLLALLLCTSLLRRAARQQNGASSVMLLALGLLGATHHNLATQFAWWLEGVQLSLDAPLVDEWVRLRGVWRPLAFFGSFSRRVLGLLYAAPLFSVTLLIASRGVRRATLYLVDAALVGLAYLALQLGLILCLYNVLPDAGLRTLDLEGILMLMGYLGALAALIYRGLCEARWVA